MEMDVKNSIDSDTSDSWSLIDINGSDYVNEGGGVDGTSIVTSGISTNDRNESKEKDNSHEPGETVEDLCFMNVSHNLNPSFSKENPEDHQDFQILYRGKVFQNDSNTEKKSSELNHSKTCLSEVEKIDVVQKIKDIDNDTDSISVISECECNDIKCAYETDENWEEKSESKIPYKVHPNVLKRKRKRLKLNYRGSSEESVSSDFMVPDVKYYSSIDYKKSNSEIQVRDYQGAPVYRHYRNNVANTVLSLAMGIIFTGVACIAVGHFLGVHDAQHTAAEMMATLKRLQMENVILHTRLAQLSRAFFSRGSNKIELLSKDEPEIKNCLNNYIDVKDYDHSVNEKAVNEAENLENQIIIPDVPISFRLGDSSDDFIYRDNIIKEKRVGQSHDQQNFHNISKFNEGYSKLPYSATVVSKSFLSPENNVANGKGLTQDSSKGKKRSWKRILKNVQDCNMPERNEMQDCIAIREKDLNKFQWFLIQKKKKRKNSVRVNENEKDSYFYKYPQPETYYKALDGITENDDNNDLLWKTSRKESKYTDHKRGPIDSKPWNSTVDNRERTEAKKYTFKIKKHKKKDRKKEKKRRDEAGKNDGSSKKFQKNGMKMPKKLKTEDNGYEKLLKDRRKCRNEFQKKNRKTKECKKTKDGCCEFRAKTKKKEEEVKKYSKDNADAGDTEKCKKYDKKNDEKSKAFCKISKKTKALNKREVNYRLRRGYYERHEFTPMNGTVCAECVNKTENWFDKWVRGRERYRRNKKISNWQFDRAKSRSHSRIGDANWQFIRAFGRESSRSEPYMYFRKKGDKYSYHKGFPSDAYSWI